MKGNKVVRLMAVMVLLPLMIAHFVGQVDLLTPSWLWITFFAGFMGLQATYTGFCPAGLVAKFSKDGQCCAEGSCCASQPAKTACCGDDKSAQKNSGCCDEGAAGCCGDGSTEKTVEKSEGKTSCCSGGACGGEKASFNVLVLGTGCANCNNTYNQIVKVGGTLAASICIEKVEDIAEIAKYGVMTTPAVVVNGQIVHSGGVPSASVIEGWFKSA
jgi:small redox-active disulfide protein 2